jgi:hypothetical protein
MRPLCTDLLIPNRRSIPSLQLSQLLARCRVAPLVS